MAQKSNRCYDSKNPLTLIHGGGSAGFNGKELYKLLTRQEISLLSWANIIERTIATIFCKE
jgi:hypothetical protein